MPYHLVEKHRDTGTSRVVMSSNFSESVVNYARHNAGLVTDSDFYIGNHSDWTPDPADITPLHPFETLPLIA